MRPIGGLLAVVGYLAAAGSLAQPGHAAAAARCQSLHGADARAKEQARTAQTAAETYATDHDGFYTGLSPRVLHRVEYFIVISRREAAREQDQAYLYSAVAIEHGYGYIVRTRAFDGDTYALQRASDGEVTRSGWQRGRRCEW
jgi:hypothetical protein